MIDVPSVKKKQKLYCMPIGTVLKLKLCGGSWECCLIVELDAKAVVDNFLNPSYQNNVVSPILDDCRHLVLQFCQIQFRHCYHQANRCADMLARMSMDQVAAFNSFDRPPMDVRSILEDDVAGLYVNRACSVTDVNS